MSVATQVVEEVSRFIPLIGPMIAVPLSFGATYYMLNHVLDRLEQVAIEVVTYAAEHGENNNDDDDNDDSDE